MGNTYGLTKKKMFEVDGIAYVVEYSDQTFLFYVDRHKSRKRVIDPDEDDHPFRSYHFYEVSNAYVSEISDYVKTSNPLRIYREVMDFVRGVIAVERPYMFGYSANEDVKKDVYARVADRIASKFNYYLVQQGNYFTFYRLAE